MRGRRRNTVTPRIIYEGFGLIRLYSILQRFAGYSYGKYLPVAYTNNRNRNGGRFIQVLKQQW